MRPESLSNRELVRRCIHGNEAEIWEEFINRTRRLVAGVVYRIAGRWNESRSEVLEELVQETYLHLYSNDCQPLRQFQPHSEDALYGFLKVVAANVAHDYLRAQNAAKRGAGVTDSVGEETPAGTPHTTQMSVAPKVEESVLLNEIESWLNKLVVGRDAEKHKAIFWLYYQQGMSAPSIAQIEAFGLTTKGVESVIYRLTHLLQGKLSFPQAVGVNNFVPSKGTREV